MKFISLSDIFELERKAYHKRLREDPEFARSSEDAANEMAQGIQRCKEVNRRLKDIDPYISHGNGD